MPTKGCFVETNSLAKRFTSAPEISSELKKFIGKKVTVSNVRRFPNESGPYQRVARQMSPFSAGHRREVLEIFRDLVYEEVALEFPKRIEVGPQKSPLNVNFEDE